MLQCTTGRKKAVSPVPGSGQEEKPSSPPKSEVTEEPKVLKVYIAPGYYVLEEDWDYYVRLRGQEYRFVKTDDWVSEDERIFSELHDNYPLMM